MLATSLDLVVLVEDNADDELLSVRGIHRSGFECTLVVLRHGGEALTYLLDPDRAVPSLIVLDFNLPGLSGLEILRGLRQAERTRKVPVVILSSTNDGSVLSECYHSGVNSCVQKPVDIDLYLKRVNMIIWYLLSVNDPSKD